MTRRAANASLALIPLLLICLFGSAAEATEWGVVSPSEWAQGAPADYPEANAIILRDSSHRAMSDIAMSAPGGGQWLIEDRRHIRKKVLTTAGIDLVGNAEFDYHKNEEVLEVRAHTILPDGTIIPVPKDQFLTKLVNDTRVTTFAFLQVDSGCIVEYSYATRFNGYFASWECTFGNELYTRESIVCLQVSGGFEYSYATSNVPDAMRIPRTRSESILHQGITKVYTWRLVDILPLASEPYMSSLADYIPRLIIQLTQYKGTWFRMDAAKDWKGLGEQFERYLNTYCNNPRGFKKYVRDLAHSQKTDYDKSRVLYDHVAKEYQRASGGFTLKFEHEKLSDIYKEKHGVGAEKNILLWCMLKQAGVKAWPVLVSTRDHGQVPPDIFRIDQFNHLLVFAEVEQGGIYLDASSPYCPYGLLPSQCRTDAGLLIDSDKSSLVRVLTSEPVSIRADLAQLYLDRDGNASCSLTSVFTGYLAIDYGSEYERSDPEEFIKSEYLDNPGFEYSLKSYSCELDTLGRLIVTAAMDMPHAAALLGEHLAAPVYQPMLGHNPFVREQRLFPIDFNYPLTYQNIVNLYVPDGYAIKTLPESIQLTANGMSYKRISQAIDGGAIWNCTLEIERPRFEIEEYPGVRDFFKSVEERSREEILFTAGS